MLLIVGPYSSNVCVSVCTSGHNSTGGALCSSYHLKLFQKSRSTGSPPSVYTHNYATIFGQLGATQPGSLGNYQMSRD